MSTSAVVALDIGRVCLELEFERCTQQFGYATVEDLAAARPEALVVMEQFETGKISETQFVEAFGALLVPDVSADVLRAKFCTLLGQEIVGMAEQVETMIRKGYRPVFFSDISPLHLRHTRSILSFQQQVADEIVSFRSGARKPASPMYVDMEQQCCDGGVPALYVDDKPENIAAGLERGWNSVQVSSLEDVIQGVAALPHL